MRVLHVTDTFLPKVGGAEIALDQLVRAMNHAGHDCSVLAQRMRGFTHEIDAPYPLRRFANPRGSLWAGWWIREHIRRAEKHLGSFDVFIGHHAFPPGYACVKHAVRTGRPSIIYPRGGDIYEASRFRRKPNAWRKLCWALGRASAVVCASAAMETLVRKIIGHSAAEGRLVRIPNGVNVDELLADASASRFNSDPRLQCPFILGLGRLISRKGFHLLIDAFSQVEKRDWKLVIAGDGREMPALQQQALPLGDRVIFTGLVEDADKRWLLQHCRFSAAPSLEESFGNVALEAMACGKPVIASRASGFSEIIRDQENGLLVDVAQVSSLTEKLAQYMRESELSNLSAQSAAATETARQFSWDQIARLYAELIDRVLQPY